ncbi:hypothetical protein FOZ60_009698 [Perkinsus olseni]|uniref:Uncharacterized protein n=1 Tax=Perkinsus olseni TaxID=32597 RepID=A0A7J6NGT2_PEROL|nr:hypothetical protein FOZ60_009698 [Perkinsus olseni]
MVHVIGMHESRASKFGYASVPRDPRDAPLWSVRTHSVASEASFDGTRPVTVCIDRNVFKSWFDTDVPEFQQLRVKRYRTIDSFVHWMMKYCKRKSIYHGLFILIRVTEAEKLLDVLTRLIPTWHNVVMGIYVGFVLDSWL